ncbi:MAG: hypothetical protein KA375_17870 [Vitreoscilla sp.]|jgi:hypothetical protein|nr:hypothetical protein [Burkholderiales bacterium]MBP6339475.1 hypothetical protein [Vitreoscilla sp.]MBP6676842.1 hypothetical protein [Vitreoscilla sp.]
MSPTTTTLPTPRWAAWPVLLAVSVASVLLWRAIEATGAAQDFAATALGVPFDQSPTGYTVAQVQEAFRQIDASGLTHYRAYRRLDLALPWVLGMGAAGWLIRLGRPAWAWLAWTVALVDTLENAALWLMAWSDLGQSHWLVVNASIVTQTKWVGYGVVLLLLGLAIFLRLRVWFTNRRGAKPWV